MGREPGGGNRIGKVAFSLVMRVCGLQMDCPLRRAVPDSLNTVAKERGMRSSLERKTRPDAGFPRKEGGGQFAKLGTIVGLCGDVDTGNRERTGFTFISDGIVTAGLTTTRYCVSHAGHVVHGAGHLPGWHHAHAVDSASAFLGQQARARIDRCNEPWGRHAARQPNQLYLVRFAV